MGNTIAIPSGTASGTLNAAALSLSESEPTYNDALIIITPDNTDIVKAVLLTVTAAPQLSAVEYSYGNGQWKTYQDPIVVLFNTTLYFRGRIGSDYTATTDYEVSNIAVANAPEVSSEVTDWTNNPVNLTVAEVTPLDPQTPLNPMTYQYQAVAANGTVDPDAWVIFDRASGVTVNDNADVYVRAVETANLKYSSYLTEYTVSNIDLIAPVIDSVSWDPVITAQPIIITVTASDNLSGVASTEYSLNGEDWVEFNDTFVLEGSGSFLLQVTDAAGNVTVGEYEVTNIDPGPVLTVDWDQNWTKGPVTVYGSASPALDTLTVVSLEYSINGGEWIVISSSTEEAGVISGSFSMTENGLFQLRAEDSLGVITVSDEYEVTNIDQTAPVIDSVTWPGEWTNAASITVSVETSDTQSGVAATYYTFNGTPWTPFDGSFEVSENGPFAIKAVDNAGNVTQSKTYNIKTIDRQAPAIDSVTWSGEWTNAESITVTVETSDNLSGVAATYYTFNGTPWQLFDGSFELTANGPFAIKALDNAGNVTQSKTYNIKTIDRLAPEISDISWDTEWTADPVAVQVTAADLADAANKASGIASLEYSLNGEDWTEFTDSFEMTENGQFQVRVTDNAGNVTLSDVQDVDNIDQTAPVIDSVTWPGGWTSAASITVTVEASDTQSGVAATYYSFNDTDWTEFEGSFEVSENGSFSVKAVDNVGNETISQTYDVETIDHQAPVIDSVTWSGEWTNADSITVTVETSDNLSGVAATYYTFSGTPWKLFDGSFDLTANGPFAIKALDNAGNVTQSKTYNIKTIDRLAPEISDISWNTEWTTEPVAIQVTAADLADAANKASGIASLEYSLDGEDWTEFTDSFDMTENGTFQVRVTDKAGNVTLSDEYEVTNIDPAPLSIESVTWDSAWTRKNVTVTVETSVTLSPIVTEYTVNGEDWTAFTGTFEMTENGTFQVRAMNAAGSSAVSDEYEVTNIDQTAPVIESVDWDKAWTAQPIEIVVTASDSQSGLGLMQYSLNGVSWVEFDGSFELTGNGFVQIQVFDAVKNAAITEITVSNFDAMPPEVFEVEWDKAWTSQPVTVTAAARDYQSGIDYLEFAINGGDWNLYEEPFVMESNGTFQFRAADLAGNVALSDVYELTNIDTVAPVIDSVTWPVDWTDADSITVTVEVSDDLSGVAATYFTFNGTPWTKFDGSFEVSADGPFAVKVVDNAGNETQSSTYNINSIDRKPPVIDSVTWSTDWTNADSITVTVEASDDQSGVAATYYMFNGSAWTEFTSTFDLTANGPFAVKVVDNAGNETVSDDYMIETIDRLAPEISDISWNTDWTADPVTVQVTAVDLADEVNKASGIAKLEFSANGGDWIEFSDSFVMEENGLFLVRVTDNAGNATLSDILVVENIDQTAPVIDSVTWPGEWTNADSITVTVEVSDDLSGVAATYFTFNGAPWTLFDGSFDVTANGPFAIKAVDNVGNVTQSKTYNIKTIDRLAPVVSDVSWDETLTNSDVTVFVSAVDFMDAENKSSGIALLEYSFDNGDWIEFSDSFAVKENGSIQIRATDNAGNSALSDFFIVKNIDKTAPLFVSVEWAEEWTHQPVNVSVTVYDAFSGVSTLEYTLDGLVWNAIDPITVGDFSFGNFDMTENGTFQLRATDAAGNATLSDEYEVTNIDTVAPVLDSITWSDEWTNAEAVQVTVEASDALSGLAAVYYRFNDSEWIAFDGSFGLTANGPFAVKAVDNAGNEKVSNVYALTTIDRLAPVISDVIWDDSWTNTPVTVQVNAVDLPDSVNPASGIAKLEFTVGGGVWSEFTDSFEITKNGTFQVRATDAAGNVTLSDEYEITNINTDGPVISTVSWDTALTRNPVTVNVSAIASVSGATVLEYTFDGQVWNTMDQITVEDLSVGSFEMTENGTFQVRASDAAGNVTVSDEYEVTNIDKIGPVISSVEWDSAWTNADSITITVEAYDSQCAVAGTYFTFQGSSWTAFDGSFSVTANGPFAVKAVDTLGNETVSKVYNIKTIDRLAPVINDVSWNTEWTSKPVTVAVAAADLADAANKASGVALLEYSFDGGDWTAFTDSFSIEENGTFQVRVTDNAGNVTVSDEYEVTNISNDGPVISTVSWDTALTRNPVTVNVSAIASVSGATVLEYSVGGDWIVIADTVEEEGIVTGSFELSENTGFQIRASDAAGNVTLSDEYEVTNIDLAGPSIDSISWSGEWTNADSITVTVEVSDALSGVAATYFTFNGTPWTLFDGSFDLTANGPFAVKAVDNVGNVTQSKTFNIKTIDRLAPVIDSVDWDNITLTNLPVTVSVAVSDPADAANKASGVAAVYYTVNGTDWTEFTDSFEVAANGPFAVKVVDNAGNETVSEEYQITTIDTQPPVISQVDWNTVWTNTSVTVTVGAFDAETSIASLEYAVDGGDWAAVPNQTVEEGVVTGNFTLAENAEFQIRATDAAGNVTISDMYAVTNIDLVAPVVDSVTWSSEWTSGGPIEVTVEASDYWSGVAATYYTFNGTPWIEFNGSFSLTENGPFAIKVVDNVGNATQSKTYNIKTVDRLAPVIDSVDWDNTTWTNADSITVTVTVSDPENAANKASGVAATYYTFNGTPWQLFDGSFDLTANGPFAIKAVDNAGNVTQSKTYNIKTIDRLAPVISDISWNTAWTPGPVEVQVSAADLADTANKASGIASLEYALDGGDWIGFTDSFEMTENGTFQVRVTDNAGNVTLSDVQEVDNIDAVAPTIDSMAWSGEWTNAPSVSVQVEVSDDYSGVAGVYYTFNGTPWTAFDGVFNLTANGPFAVKVVDNAGNTTQSKTYNIKTIDRLAPVITDVSWNTEWTTEPVTIEVAAADLADAANKASGVAMLEYAVDGGDWTEFTDSFEMTENGTFQVRVTDNAGNVTVSDEYVVDNIDPAGTTFSVAWNEAWTNAPVTVAVAATAYSGVNSLEYTVNGEDWMAVEDAVEVLGVLVGSFELSENTGFQLRATDGTGVTSFSDEFEVTNIDLVAPMIDSMEWSGEWTNADSITVTVETSDDLSGVAATYFTFNGTPWSLFDGSFELTANGPFAVKAVDNAGNVTQSKTYNIKTIDRLAPQISDISWNTEWTPDPVTVQVTAADLADAANKASGIAALEYSFNGGDWTEFTDSFIIETNGTFQVRVTDAAGNETLSDVLDVDNIDPIAPKVIVADWSSDWSTKPITIGLSAFDDLSGLALFEYTLNGEDWISVPLEFDTPTEKLGGIVMEENGSFQVRAEDAAGNLTVSDVYEVTTIDTVGPVIDSVTWSGEWTNAESITVTVETSDNLSGVAATYYTFSGTPWKLFDGSFDLTANGPFAIKALDNAGNVTQSKTYNIKTIDRLAPEISDISWDTEWTTEPVTIEVAANDLADAANKASGIASLEYSLNGEDWTEFTDTFEMTENGQFQVRVTDNAGNVALSDVLDVDNIDQTAPVLEFEFDNDWTTEPVTVNVFSIDTQSGLASLEYSVNGGEWAVIPDQTEVEEITLASFVMEENGTFQLRASDILGNQTVTEVTEVTNIDRVAPTVDSVVWSSAWTNAESVKVTVKASDDLSGVALTFFTVNGTWWTEFSGSFDVTENGPFAVKVIDNAGNETVSDGYTIETIDRLAPVISDISWNTEWTSEPVTIQVTAVDLADAANKASGIAALEYTFNGEDWIGFTDSFVMKENGTFWVRAIDAAGNETVSDIQMVDNIDPYGTLIVVEWNDAWTNAPVTVDVMAAAFSGVVSLEYTVNGEDWLPVDIAGEVSGVTIGSFELTENTEFQVRATDGADVISFSDEYEVTNIDLIAPSFDSVVWPSDWTNADSITVTVETSDNLSGVAATYFTFNGSPWTLFDGSFDVTANGPFAIKALDNAGNVTQSTAYNIKTIDRLAPVISDISWNTAWTTGNVAVKVSADDLADAANKASGIAALEYSLDGENWIEFSGSFKMTDNGSFQVRASDNAGNQTVSDVLTVTNIDRVDPVFDSVDWDHSWTTQPVEIEVAASDAQSGIAVTQYSLNGLQWVDFEDSFTVATAGLLQIRAIDQVGNVTILDTEIKNIDLVAPEIDDVDWNTAPTSDPVTIKVVALDYQSGMASTEYEINGGDWTLFENTFTMDTNGTFKIRATDIAGNQTVSDDYIVDNIIGQASQALLGEEFGDVAALLQQGAAAAASIPLEPVSASAASGLTDFNGFDDGIDAVSAGSSLLASTDAAGYTGVSSEVEKLGKANAASFGLLAS